MDNRDYDGMTVLDALADTTIDALLLALGAAKSGKYLDANELLGFTDRLTYQIFIIEDHNKSANRSGSPMCDINIGMEAPRSVREPSDPGFA